MKKHLIIILVAVLLICVGLSGCIQVQQNWANDAGACCVLSVIGLVLFIILIAYLLGGKKTVVQTTQTTPAPPVVIYKETSPREREKTKHDRRCPSCGRVIPDDAKLCPYCGKKFELHFKEYRPECGSKIQPDADFCEECGNRL